MEGPPRHWLPTSVDFEQGTEHDLGADLGSFTVPSYDNLGLDDLNRVEFSNHDNSTVPDSGFDQMNNMGSFNSFQSLNDGDSTHDVSAMSLATAGMPGSRSTLAQQSDLRARQQALSDQQVCDLFGTSGQPAQCGQHIPCDPRCPVRRDELAANALISFTGGPRPHTDGDHPLACCRFLSTDEGASYMPPDELPAWNHILSCHDQGQEFNCVRPCPAERPEVYGKCQVPLQYTELDTNILISGIEDDAMLELQDGPVCGFKFNAPVDYINHFNSFHRNVLPLAHRHHALEVPSSVNTHSYLPDSSFQAEAADGVGGHDEAAADGESAAGTREEAISNCNISLETRFMCFWASSSNGCCGANFVDGEELQQHVQNAHLGSESKVAKRYKCKWRGCARSSGFEQRSKLLRHLQTHTGYKAEKCPICGEMLSARQALEQHKLTHTGEKPWACDWPKCGKSFRQQSALTVHKRTHTQEKPLACEICGKTFSESSNLSKHRKTHGGHLPLKCPEQGCVRAFRRPDQLRRHLTTHSERDGKHTRSGEDLNNIPSGVVRAGSHDKSGDPSQSVSSGDTETDRGGASATSDYDACIGDGVCCFDSGCENNP